jgi:hypothetical protein
VCVCVCVCVCVYVCVCVCVCVQEFALLCFTNPIASNCSVEGGVLGFGL